VADPKIYGSVLYAGVNGNGTHAGNPNKNKLSPRIGFAYSLSDKTVIRGGYGIYRDWVTLGNAENNLKGNPPGFVLPTFFNNASWVENFLRCSAVHSFFSCGLSHASLGP